MPNPLLLDRALVRREPGRTAVALVFARRLLVARPVLLFGLSLEHAYLLRCLVEQSALALPSVDQRHRSISQCVSLLLPVSAPKQRGCRTRSDSFDLDSEDVALPCCFRSELFGRIATLLPAHARLLSRVS